jgi:CBS domain-containing protein
LFQELNFMKVKKIMTTDVGCCRLEDNLMQVVEMMRQKNCGVVPIVNEENRLAGIVTDRDICLAVGELPNRKISSVKAGEIISGEVVACAPEDKIETALKKMRKHQLKRLPVVDKNGQIAGILSVTDVVLSAGKNKTLKKQIYSTFKGIFEPRPIVLQEIAVSPEV